MVYIFMMIQYTMFNVLQVACHICSFNTVGYTPKWRNTELDQIYCMKYMEPNNGTAACPHC